MFLIVVSKKDIAGMNMLKIYLNNYNFKEMNKEYRGSPLYKYKNYLLVTVDTELIEAEYLDEDFPDVELIIFSSRHSSSKRISSLTVHADGNWCSNTLGGKPRKISIAPSLYMLSALKLLKKYQEERKLGYQVSYEVTHHGPNLNKPSLWVEVGGTIENWNDIKACEVVVDTIMNLGIEKAVSAIGIGGPHYAPSFTKRALKENIAFGHMIPKYVLDCIDEEMIKLAIERTIPKPEIAYIDWKSSRKYKEKFLPILEEYKLKIRKIK